MLRITVDEDGACCMLKLAGRLGPLWVHETGKAWRSALCSSAARIEIDMREVTGVDDEGRQLLTSMHRAGAHLVGQGVKMTALLEEITGNQPEGAPGA